MQNLSKKHKTENNFLFFVDSFQGKTINMFQEKTAEQYTGADVEKRLWTLAEVVLGMESLSMKGKWH